MCPKLRNKGSTKSNCKVNNNWNKSRNIKWFSCDITRRGRGDPRTTLVSARDYLLTDQAFPFKRKLYISIKRHSQCNIQISRRQPAEWEIGWDMEFNPGK